MAGGSLGNAKMSNCCLSLLPSFHVKQQTALGIPAGRQDVDRVSRLPLVNSLPREDAWRVMNWGGIELFSTPGMFFLFSWVKEESSYQMALFIAQCY